MPTYGYVVEEEGIPKFYYRYSSGCFGGMISGLPEYRTERPKNKPVGVWVDVNGVDKHLWDYVTTQTARYSIFEYHDGPQPKVWFRIPEGTKSYTILHLCQMIRYMATGGSPQSILHHDWRFQNFVEAGIDPDYTFLIGTLFEMKKDGTLACHPTSGYSAICIPCALTPTSLAEWKVIGRHKSVVDVRNWTSADPNRVWTYSSGYGGGNTTCTTCTHEEDPLKGIRNHHLRGALQFYDQFDIQMAQSKQLQNIKVPDSLAEKEYLLWQFSNVVRGEDYYDKIMKSRREPYGPYKDAVRFRNMIALEATDFLNDICTQADTIVDEMLDDSRPVDSQAIA